MSDWPQYLANAGTALTIRYSDGDASTLPEEEKEIIFDDGTVDYTCAATEETNNHWLKKIGNYLVHEGTWNRLSTLSLSKPQ